MFGNVDNSSVIAQEEIFGPVLSVIPAADEADAVRIANDTIYGLHGAAFTSDVDRAREVAGQMRTGAIGHNGFKSDFNMGHGGFKQSGIGREGGVDGLLACSLSRRPCCLTARPRGTTTFSSEQHLSQGGPAHMTTAADTISTPLLIACEERPGSAGVFPVYDPAHSGAVIGYAAAASADDALAAVAAAEAAWPAWAAMSATERVGIVLKALAGLEADNDERTDILSREYGKHPVEAFIDLAVFSGRFHHGGEYAPELDVDEHIPRPPFNTTITKLSRGVVTIIYPFNWPLAILAASLPAGADVRAAS